MPPWALSSLQRSKKFVTMVPLECLSPLCSTLALTPSIKASLWTNLLSISSLQFTVPGNDMPFSPDDDKIKRFEDAEKLYLKIVAKEHLRDSFVGLYDTTSTGISSNQRSALKRLAVASFFLLPSKFTKNKNSC
ncbi:hypothetical protein BDE02_01G153700 [Populus trichocarpa]|nr:hypothetical protein BDE02_01G153700 [Populus trichocarpa]